MHIMKVGIIGGGAAGLTAAWLLDQECEVVLFEKEARLGGHAHTIQVPYNGTIVPIEIGFGISYVNFLRQILLPFCNLKC